ncbi:MAG TPA: porin family protein [Flavipsychrobacter sp.]|nr:porin family protein [Flavipsychrobacter sp.]
MRLKKFVLSIICLFYVLPAMAQRDNLNMVDHDDKLYYFGITFGLNFSEYRVHYTSAFVHTDTFKTIQPRWSPGFNLGLMANLRLNKFIDLRFVPSLAFAEKRLVFDMTYPTDSTSDRTIEAILMHLPLQLKFKSDRIRNFRFYAITGGKFDYDLAANARSHRTDEFLKVSPIDAGFELGVGFEFFNPNFIFSPEIKLSQGLINQIYHDPSVPLDNAIQTLHTRMIVISIHLEG